MRLGGKQLQLKAKYNITAWPNLRINFWGIPKCGNTSMKYALLVNSGIDGQKDEVMKWVHNHGGAKYIDIQTARNNGFQNVTITRNPYDRFVSMYKDVLRRPKMFRLNSVKSVDSFIKVLDNKSVKDMHFKLQCQFITINDTVIPDIVLDLDTLDENFMNLNIQKYNSINKEVTLTAEQKQHVYELYRQDFELLGYHE